MNKKTSTIIAEAESAEMPKVLDSQSEDAAARALHPETQQDTLDAEDHLSRTINLIKKLDARVTPADLADAETGHRFAQYREAGAKRRLGDAKTRLRFCEVGIGEVVADASRSILPGASIFSTFAIVTHKPQPAELPLAVVSQLGATTTHANGTISGVCEVVLHRHDKYKELVRADLADALAALGVVGEVSFVSHPTPNSDRVQVTVHSAPVPMPLIPDVATSRRDQLGRTLAHKVASAVKYYDETVQGGLVSGLAQVSRLAVVPVATELNEQKSDGFRTLTVTSTLAVRLDKPLPNHDGVLALLTDVCATLPGTFQAGLGVVREITVAPADDSKDQPAADAIRLATNQPVDASQIGRESVFAWTVTTVLDSAYNGSAAAAA